jgi:hypothetical protein
MPSDHPDTLQFDRDAEPIIAPPPTEPPEREWYESPWLWAVVVVALLLSIPLLLELTSGGKRSASRARADGAPSASSAASALPAARAPTPAVAASPPSFIEPPRAGDPGTPPPRATPLSVMPRPPEPAPRQTVIKCMEKGGRIVYTQTGACTGSMVPVPIEVDKNVVDSPLPPRAPASRP